MISRLIIFGATGDLTRRYLLPALAQLSAGGYLPDDFAVVGAAQQHWDEDAFRRHARVHLEKYGADTDVDVREALVKRLSYRSVDVTDGGSVTAVVDAVTGTNRDTAAAAYLALPTALIPPTVTAFGSAALPAGSRIAVEKPFGEDLQSARDLNALLASTFSEGWEQVVFRVDHALGMTAVQNLLPLRFTNRILSTAWNGRHIAEVEVLWEETLALEGRAAFYDRAGALKDVMQNHMIQVLCMAAMERPQATRDGSPEVEELRRCKLDFLRGVRELSPDDIRDHTRRARYTAGRLPAATGDDVRDVPDYVAEHGVDAGRNTETFAEVVLTVDNPRWAGTTFRLRAGKALSETRKGVLIRFRPEAAAQHVAANGDQFWIGVDGPNDLTLSLNSLAGSESPGLTTLDLSGLQPDSHLSPYAHVLLNLLGSRNDLAVGGEEAEEAWRILGPVRDAWDRDLVPMQEYPAGSAGPPHGAVSDRRTP